MDPQLAVICALAFVNHLVGTLAYAVRIAGGGTRRIAVSFALFNILVLVSRTSNSFQGPFLAKRIEDNIRHSVAHGLLADFRWLLLSATAVVWLVGRRRRDALCAIAAGAGGMRHRGGGAVNVTHPTGQNPFARPVTFCYRRNRNGAKPGRPPLRQRR